MIFDSYRRTPTHPSPSRRAGRGRRGADRLPVRAGDAAPRAAWSWRSRTTRCSFRATSASRATSPSTTRSARRHPHPRQPALGVHDAQAQYNARRKPSPINYHFTQIDQLIDRAALNGIRIHLSLTGPAPRWANAQGAPQQGLVQAERGPVRQVRARRGASTSRAACDRYSIWNEPNWKTWLGPLKSAPAIYRSMYSRGLQGDQEGRPARAGADRRDEPVRAPGLRPLRRSPSCARSCA